MTDRWMRNCWQAAAYAHEIGDGMLPRTILSEPIVFFRTSDGVAHALADKCAHRGLPLSCGRKLGDVLECGYHGMAYEADGTCVRAPGQDRVPAAAVVKTYPVAEKHGFVWIWMGQPEKAASAEIPDFFWFKSDDWACAAGYHLIGADYRLLNDNLLDLSHESFVHQETIGNAAVADSPVTAEIVDGTVRVSRYMNACEPPPFYVRVTGFTEKIDRWHTTIYTPPGLLVIENGSMPTGSDRAAAKERRVLHLITPETESTSHYFWGVARQYDKDDAALTEFLRSGTATTFDQDKHILEAQQRSLGVDPQNAFAVKMKIDVGPLLGRKLLDQKLAEDIQSRTLVPA